MKTIAVLIGSLREKSYNRMLFEAYQNMSEGKFRFEEIKYHDFPFYNQDLQDIEMPQQVKDAGSIVRESAGVLFISPEYNYSLPGALKNAIDWLSRLENQPFKGKPAAIMGCSPSNQGTARMQYHLRQMGVFLDLRVMNGPEVMVSQCQNKFSDKGQIEDARTKEILRDHIQAFKQFIVSYH